jgi:hypothetical protein
VKRWAQTVLLATMMVLPAVAGRELDNRQGVFDGTYMAVTCQVRKPDVDETQLEKVPFVLRHREAVLELPDKLDKCRVEQIYDTGFNTEITCTSFESDTRYFLKLKGRLATRF